jgi:hypothetical protein
MEIQNSMSHYHTRKTFLVAAIVGLLLTACGSVVVEVNPVSILSDDDSNEQKAESENTIQISAMTWNDINGNGSIEQGEPPLGYMRVTLDGHTSLSTNADGIAKGTMLVGPSGESGDSETFLISVDPPDGYLPTTPAQVEFDLQSELALIYFGLRPDPAFPQVFQRPQSSLVCAKYPVLTDEEGEFGALGSLADGTLLLSLYTEYGHRQQLFQFDYQEDDWIKFNKSTDFSIHSFYGDSQSDFWVHSASSGVFNFDGEKWLQYRNIARFGGMADLCEDGNGVPWVANGGNQLHFLPSDSDVWSSFLDRAVNFGAIHSIDRHQDGTLWVVGNEIAHIFPSARRQAGYDVDTIPFPDSIEDEHDWTKATLDDDGILWIVRVFLQETNIESRFYRFDTENGLIEELTYENTRGMMPPIPFFDIKMGFDSSIWATLRQRNESTNQEETLVHFIPANKTGEDQWIIHDDFSQYIQGTVVVEAVDLDGGVWVRASGDEQALYRCFEEK